MFKQALIPFVAAAAIFGSTLVAGAQMSAMGGTEHGMPESTMGGPGDKLHPNRTGYLAMGQTIDLDLFKPGRPGRSAR